MTIAYILFFVGIIFFALTSVGLLRFPDAYSRVHAASLGDTLGFAFIVVGLMFLMPGLVNAFKLLLVLGIIWIINPTTSHYVGKVALLRGNWVIVRQRSHSTQDKEAASS